MGYIRTLSFLILTSCWAHPADANYGCGEPGLNRSYLVCAFENTAFQQSLRPYSEGFWIIDSIYKWKNLLDVVIVDDRPNHDWYNKIKEKHISSIGDLSRITGYNITIQSDNIDAHIKVIISARSRFRLQFKDIFKSDREDTELYISRTICISTNAIKDPKSESIIIHSFLDDEIIHHCFLTHLIRVLGLTGFGGVDQVSLDKIDGPPFKELTTVDKFLIRTLYDPRIKANMPKDEAMAQAKIIIPELIEAYKERGISALYQ